nr:hypothetical protein [Tanacetum cinerariifolium]GFA19881.1 hypothetical protein [Tanacetum cinerariifolium]GFA20302.1 hypothetical protein [Tanacetum cinerariifolium]
MEEPLSPDHVFDFPADDPTHDFEDPDMDVDENPEEDPEEVIPPAIPSPPRSPPISPPPLLESSSDSDSIALVTTDRHPGATLAAIDKDQIEWELYMIRDMLTGLQLEISKRGAEEARLTESIDVLAVYGDAQPSKPQGLLDGRALTWWNGYVYSLRIDAANQIPSTEFKQMMTDEYCLRNELQRMEHKLWSLMLKGDDIDGYTNPFHKLVALCPLMVTPEYKKIE